jgi:hypothetical protein
VSDKPFCVFHAPSIGVAPGQRGPKLGRDRFATFEEATKAARHLPAGHSLLIITEDTPDGEVIHWPSYDVPILNAKPL